VTAAILNITLDCAELIRKRERDDRDVGVVKLGGQLSGRADQEQAPARLLEAARGHPQVPGEHARTAHVGGGQVDDHHVGACGQLAERRTESAERRPVQRSRRARDHGEPPGLLCCRRYRRHDAPDVAMADPDVAEGADAADEDEDDELLAGVLAAELAVPDAAAPCWAEAGSAIAIAAALAALTTAVAAVAAASLVLPRRRFRLALASSASGDSCSVVMVASRFIAQIGSWLIQPPRAGSMAHTGRLGGCYEISPPSGRQQNPRRNRELNLRRPGAYTIAHARS
jgi:hypothetical protein